MALVVSSSHPMGSSAWGAAGKELSHQAAGINIVALHFWVLAGRKLALAREWEML
jgi:hypothetical protein